MGFIRHFGNCARYAWRESYVAALGGVIGGVVWWMTGPPMPFPTFISENPYFSGAANVLACVLGGVLIVFLGRLIYSPIHFAVERRGGLRTFLRQRLGTQMWPILFMGFGILTFVILFGLGMVLFAIQLSPYREPQKVSDQDLIKAYLLMGKSGEIKKKCSASFVGANTEINVISDGNPRSIDFIDTLKKLLSPEISVKAIELLQNETIDPGISLIVPSLNPADASYISVEWVKCLSG